MAIQQLNLTPTPHPLGEAIGSGLEQLASHKMQQIQRQNLGKGLESLGYPQELAHLPPQLIQAEIANRGRQQTALMKHQLELQQQQNFERALQGYGQSQIEQQPQQQHPTNRLPSQNIEPQLSRGEMIGNDIFGTTKRMSEVPNAGIMQAPQQPSHQQKSPAQTRESRAPKSMPVPIGLTPQQHMQYLSHIDRAQAQADSSNKKPLEELGNAVKTAKEMIELVDEMDTLLSTGKVATGIKGKIPLALQNAETQQYAAKANELATLLAASQRGVPSAYRIKIAQSTKPSIEQALKAQKGLQEDIRRKASAVIGRGDIVDQIIGENGGYQPPNIMSLVNERLRSFQGENSQPTNRFTAPENNRQQASNEESPLGTLTRGAIRTGARFIEPLGEQVQNIASLGLGIGNLATGGTIPTYGELREKYPFLPPANLSEITNKITNGYTAPQSELEEFVDNIASTAGTLSSALVGGSASAITKGLSFIINPRIATKAANIILPFSGIPWQKALKAAVATEAVGKFLENIDASPATQTAGRIATLIAASGGFGKGAMLKSAENNYALAKEAAAGKSINATPIEKKLSELALKTAKGFDPDKRIIEQVINEAQEAINASKGGGSAIPINSLIDLKQQANKWYSTTEFPRVSGEKHLPKGSKRVIGEITSILNEPIKEYGLQHPSFGKPFAMAEDIWKGVHDVDSVNKWIKKNFSHHVGLRTDLVKAFVKNGLTFTAGKAAEHIKLLMRPATRNHILRAIKAAADENKNAFGREIKLLDKQSS